MSACVLYICACLLVCMCAVLSATSAESKPLDRDGVLPPVFFLASFGDQLSRGPFLSLLPPPPFARVSRHCKPVSSSGDHVLGLQRAWSLHEPTLPESLTPLHSSVDTANWGRSPCIVHIAYSLGVKSLFW